jgi:hypothetical protein
MSHDRLIEVYRKGVRLLSGRDYFIFGEELTIELNDIKGTYPPSCSLVYEPYHVCIYLSIYLYLVTVSGLMYLV